MVAYIMNILRRRKQRSIYSPSLTSPIAGSHSGSVSGDTRPGADLFMYSACKDQDPVRGASPMFPGISS